MYAGSGCGGSGRAGEGSLGLGLSALPSLIDRVRLRRVKGFGLGRFGAPELS